MLINYKIENFLSIADEVSLNMIASTERKHPSHVIQPPGRKNFRILRTAAIYGANASGKSNFFKSLNVLEKIATSDEGIKGIRHNKLSGATSETPTKYSISYLFDKKVYIYTIHASRYCIFFEELKEVDSKFDESLIFSRKKSENLEFKFRIGDKIKERLTDNEAFFYEELGRSTPETTSFAYESHRRKLKELDFVFKWFEKCLVMVSPESVYALLEIRMMKEEKFKKIYNSFLSEIDTGIESIDTVVEEVEESEKDGVKRKLLDKKRLARSSNEKRLVYLEDENDEMFKITVQTKRKDVDGKMVDFKLDEESDGTLRMLDLMPILALDNRKMPITYIFDEIDRSIHPLISKKLIEMNGQMNENRLVQLIFSTHDVFLMDLSYIRRDEIWFIEKANNFTRMYSLHDFDLRYDKDIRKEYLKGRFGAIPCIGAPDILVEQ